MYKFLFFSFLIHSLCFINYDFLFYSKNSEEKETIEFSYVDSQSDDSKSQKIENPNIQSYKKEGSLNFISAKEIKTDSFSENNQDKDLKTYLGLGLQFSPDEQFYINVNGEGRLVGYKVFEVHPNYGAFYAGIKKDDIILKVKGISIKNKISFLQDEKVEVLVFRNNSVIVLKVKIMKIPYV